jgi:hypothetical protein
MGEWAIKVLVVGFVVWMVWSVLQPHYVFDIRIDRGRPRVRRGKVTAAFVGQVAEACQDGGVDRGWIGGVRLGQRVALRFSRHFPPGLQQRLRNEWQTAG